MKKNFLILLTIIFLICSVSSNAQNIALLARGGYLSASQDNDAWDHLRGPIFSLGILYSPVKNLDLVLSSGYFRSTEVFRTDRLDLGEDVQMTEDLDLEVVPLNFEVRLRFAGLRDSFRQYVDPYLGLGTGSYYWDFIDERSLEGDGLNTYNRLSDDGVTWGFHFLAGSFFPLSENLDLLLELKYSWAQAKVKFMDEDLGLGGFEAALGIAWKL